MTDANDTQPVIEVCMGPECRESGAAGLLEELKDLGRTTLRGNCRGLCTYAPVVHNGKHCIPEASVERILVEP